MILTPIFSYSISIEKFREIYIYLEVLNYSFSFTNNCSFSLTDVYWKDHIFTFTLPKNRRQQHHPKTREFSTIHQKRSRNFCFLGEKNVSTRVCWEKKLCYARNIHLGSIVFFEENNLHDNSKTIWMQDMKTTRMSHRHGKAVQKKNAPKSSENGVLKEFT